MPRAVLPCRQTLCSTGDGLAIVETFDVIIVLGAAQAPDGTPGPVISRRVLHAVKLFNEGRAPVMLMSGGATRHAEPEADAMARVAIEAGISDQAIFRETRSTRTMENVLECRKILTREDWHHALVVTDSFHMKRALYTFDAFGVEAFGDGVPAPPSLRTVLAHICEFFVRQMYERAIRAYIDQRISPLQLGGGK